jgi:hypothetical protein
MKSRMQDSDTPTHYRIEVRGRVNLDWLRDFAEDAQIVSAEAGPGEEITVVTVRADQAGAVGLVRRLHGLGMTILQVQAVPARDPGNEAEAGGRVPTS